jgi:hypothetical protein
MIGTEDLSCIHKNSSSCHIHFPSSNCFACILYFNLTHWTSLTCDIYCACSKKASYTRTHFLYLDLFLRENIRYNVINKHDPNTFIYHFTKSNKLEYINLSFQDFCIHFLLILFVTFDLTQLFLPAEFFFVTSAIILIVVQLREYKRLRCKKMGRWVHLRDKSLEICKTISAK